MWVKIKALFSSNHLYPYFKAYLFSHVPETFCLSITVEFFRKTSHIYAWTITFWQKQKNRDRYAATSFCPTCVRASCFVTFLAEKRFQRRLLLRLPVYNCTLVWSEISGRPAWWVLRVIYSPAAWCIGHWPKPTERRV